MIQLLLLAGSGWNTKEWFRSWGRSKRAERKGEAGQHATTQLEILCNEFFDAVEKTARLIPNPNTDPGTPMAETAFWPLFESMARVNTLRDKAASRDWQPDLDDPNSVFSLVYILDETAQAELLAKMDDARNILNPLVTMHYYRLFPNEYPTVPGDPTYTPTSPPSTSGTTSGNPVLGTTQDAAQAPARPVNWFLLGAAGFLAWVVMRGA